MKFEAALDAANNSGLLSLNSFWTIENCMSALAATNHDIDEHNKHRVLPVPVGDSNIAFFCYIYL